MQKERISSKVITAAAVVMALALLVWGNQAANAGRLYTLVSGKTTGYTSGTSQAVDGHYKDWTYQAVCTGNRAADQSVMKIRGSLDGSTWFIVNQHQWTTTQSTTGSHLWWATMSIPIKYIYATWDTISWTTVGSCKLYGLGVN